MIMSSFAAALAFAASACVVPDFDYRLSPWKTKADEWRGSPTQPTGVTDWSGYDRLAVDVVNFDIGGEAMCVYLKSDRPMTSLVSFRTPCLAARTYTLPLERFARGGVNLTNVTAVSFSARWATGLDARICNVRLLKKDEVAEDAKLDAALASKLEARRAAWKADRAKVHAQAFARWRGACAAAGTVAKGAVFGKASPMHIVRPRDDFEAEPATELGVRLARNEKESVQFLMAPDGADLADVRVTVEMEGGFASSNVVVAPMGYVELKRVPEHSAGFTPDPAAPGGLRRVPVMPGWWPDPILDFLGSVETIRGDDVQSFWVKVRCPENQPAGVYRGRLRATWSAGGAPRSWETPFSVRVNDFTLGRVSPIPLSMSYQPGFFCHNWERLDRIVSGDIYKCEHWIHAHTNCAPYLARRRLGDWTDFLADNLITVDFLYPMVGPRWDELARLKAEGRLGFFNLKYWNHTSNRDSWFDDARKRYEKAKELGLLDHAVFYGADELPKEVFPGVEAMAARLKKEFPGVRLVTTLKDSTYSVGTELKSLDVFVPVTASYRHENARKARAAGKRVGWYVCGGGDDAHAEFFFGRDAIEPRLLTSAAAAKFDPEWFLYYAIAVWSTIEPITRGPFTAWSPEAWQDYVGDGCIVACGPAGRPLSTMRLENFRDGLEDYAYAKLYREKTGRQVEVPDDLVTDLAHYTHDPKALQGWRDRMADAIEGGRR